MKARLRDGASDDFDCPVSEFDESLAQIGAVVDAVGKQVAQPRKQVVDGFYDEFGTIAILDVGWVDRDADQQAGSIRHDMALSAQPVRAMYKIASSTAHKSVARGRPKVLRAGI